MVLSPSLTAFRRIMLEHRPTDGFPKTGKFHKVVKITLLPGWCLIAKDDFHMVLKETFTSRFL